MTEQHPITPPPELRRLWAQQAQRMDPHDPVAWMQHVSAKAASWGADQELEACCAWLSNHNWRSVEPALRAARRRPPSLKEQALESLRFLGGNSRDVDTIRRALNQLDD